MKNSIIFLLWIFSLNTLFSQSPRVIFLKIDGSINPAVSEYIHDEIIRAAEDGAAAVVVDMNTPGGLLKSTRLIVTDFLTSPLPVVVYVSPQGSQAASAGVFITMAAHIAVMAPGTNIGSAHPVNAQGGMDSIMSEKVTNDAAAFIRTISEKRKRNVAWAEEAVRKSVSITETEALKINVIDFIAPNRQSLLDSLDGRTVMMGDKKIVLALTNAVLEEREMAWYRKILDTLSDPNIAYILMMIGMYGLIFELYNPGAVFPGVAGAICLLLGLYSMHTLPVNYSGAALIVLGIVLFVLELKVASYGLLTAGGILSLFLGSIMLIRDDQWFNPGKVSLELIIPTIIFTALFFIFALRAALKAQKRKPATGIEGLRGTSGITTTKLHPHGKVRIQGELWTAESVDGIIPAETEIIVTAIDGLTAKVKRIPRPKAKKK